MSKPHDHAPKRPTYREAQVVSSEAFHAALDSGDVDRIHYALIDASRCLDDDEVYLPAVGLLGHEEPRVRYAALFALDQCRGSIVRRLQQDYEPIHSICRLAWEDADESVRSIAVTALSDFLSECLSAVPKRG